MSDRDIIDTLAGLAPDSPLTLIRDSKPVTRQQAQSSYRALFEPAAPGDVAIQERFAVAAFVAGLHAQDEIAAFYAGGVSRTSPSDEFLAALLAEIQRGRATGPYGAYPKGPLSAEDVSGPIYRVAQSGALGVRLSAALEHAHMLVFHPRDANPAALQTLFDAGWSATGIVTLSQLVAFLAFQIRVAAGLRAFAAAGSAS
jgi:CMD domain protein